MLSPLIVVDSFSYTPTPGLNATSSSHSFGAPNPTSSLTHNSTHVLSPAGTSSSSQVNHKRLTNLVSNSTYSLFSSIHNFSLPPILQFIEHHMLTRAKTSQSKPKALLAHVDPTLVKQDLSHPNCFQEMQLEYDKLLTN